MSHRGREYDELREVSYSARPYAHEGSERYSYGQSLSRRARRYLSQSTESFQELEDEYEYEEEVEDDYGYGEPETQVPLFGEPPGYKRGAYEAATVGSMRVRGSFAWAPVPDYASSSADTALKWGLLQPDGSPTHFGNTVMGRSWSRWLVDELQERSAQHGILQEQRARRSQDHVRGLRAAEEKVARSLEHLQRRHPRSAARTPAPRQAKSLPNKPLAPLHIADKASETPKPAQVLWSPPWGGQGGGTAPDTLQRLDLEDGVPNLASPAPRPGPRHPAAPPLPQHSHPSASAPSAAANLQSGGIQQQPPIVGPQAGYFCCPSSAPQQKQEAKPLAHDLTMGGKESAQVEQAAPRGENRDMYWATSLICCA